MRAGSGVRAARQVLGVSRVGRNRLLTSAVCVGPLVAGGEFCLHLTLCRGVQATQKEESLAADLTPTTPVLQQDVSKTSSGVSCYLHASIAWEAKREILLWVENALCLPLATKDSNMHAEK